MISIADRTPLRELWARMQRRGPGESKVSTRFACLPFGPKPEQSPHVRRANVYGILTRSSFEFVT
jgi:hypothetical protein